MSAVRPLVFAMAAILIVGPAIRLAHGEPAAKDPVLKTLESDGKTPVRTTSGDLELVMDSVAAPDNARAPRLTGTIGGKPAFSIRLGDDPIGGGAAKLGIVRLDGKVPQVVFQHFTFGAHCCTETAFATSFDGTSWTIVNGEMLDGDGGYGFEDIDGDGNAELLSSDNSFLYAFAAYADSLAPIRINKLEGDRLVDVSHDAKYRAAVTKSLAGIEQGLGPGSDTWHSNGFLAGWVATKVLLDQGPEAWQRMLKSYQRDSGWTMNVCIDPLPIEKCADDRQRAVDFPEALRTHLLTHGYIAGLADYPLPKGTR